MLNNRELCCQVLPLGRRNVKNAISWHASEHSQLLSLLFLFFPSNYSDNGQGEEMIRMHTTNKLRDEPAKGI